MSLSKMRYTEVPPGEEKWFVCISLITVAGLFLYHAAMHEVF